MKHFYSSFIIMFVGLILAFYVGAWQAVYICVLLSILEISLSFDNAVVNAKVLNTMDEKWQKRFIYWGIPIAVFGMRFLFPIAIVAIAANIGMLETLKLALLSPLEYQQILESTKYGIYAFGSGFLLMVFLQFFFEEKEIYWLSWLENNKFTRLLMKLGNISFFIALLLGIILLSATKDSTIGIAYFCAIALYFFIHSINSLFDASAGVRNGLIGFLYLEMLDASFSLDGVIGAFALSDNIFIIMIGLGIGAMFVRSLTIYLVAKKTLQELVYLEHGAHYAIGTLAFIMLAKIFIEVSEVLTGLIGVSFILVAFICSKKYK